MAGIGSLQELQDALAGAGSSSAPQLCVDAILSVNFPDIDAGPAVLLGLSRVEPELDHAEKELRQAVSLQGNDWKSISIDDVTRGVDQLSGQDEALGLLLRGSGRLAEMKRRLDIYDEIAPVSRADVPAAESLLNPGTAESTKEDDGMDLDDPWADGAEEEADSPPVDDPWESTSDSEAVPEAKAAIRQESPPTDDVEDVPFELRAFIEQPIYTSVTTLASAASLHALKLVCERYEETLWPSRLEILGQIPPWVSPVDIEAAGLLPGANETGEERRWSYTKQLDRTFLDRLADVHVSLESPAAQNRRPSPLSASELTQWYTDTIEDLDKYGLLDVQLAWVQHGAAQSVSGLDALGEDLSLLSRLVYDAHLSPTQHAQWSLASWRSASQSELVSAYLSGSTALTIVDDIRRLVLPYLYVLESRAERAGQADPQLVNRLLHDAILELPLHLALPVFEASKATLPKHERLVKDDMTVARLALACLYGSRKKDIWATMSAIFECLPVWDVSGGDLDSDREATSTTLESIATFVRPTKAGDSPPTPKDLFFFFSPLPFASLSRALDVLDVQLESGEVLSRWDTPVQLQFLLQSASNKDEQRDLAERMVRRQTSKLHGEREWWNLWTDMKKLNGGNDALLRGAFGALNTQEMMAILLGGAMSSGTRRVIKRLQTEEDLPAAMLETVVLSTSRELYDNAESGNIHSGNMKLAYDCLSVAPSSPVIVREKGFIEATSRLTSFHPFPPLTIRHTQNKLDLIRTIIDSGSGATRHPEIVLDLVDKLGYKGDSAARAEVLGMLGEAAVEQDELDSAWEHCEALISLVDQTKRSSRRASGSQAAAHGQIRAVCWKACLKLGKRPDVDVHRRMTLLGKSIELCPADQVSGILAVWREAEEAYLAAGQEARRRRLAGKEPASRPAQPSLPALSVAEGDGEEERVLGSRTAARAARLAKVALNPLSAKIPHLPGSASPRLASEGFATVISSGLFRSASRDSDRHRDRDRSAVSSPLLPHTGDDAHLSPVTGAGDRLGAAAFGEETDAERVSRHAKRAFTRGVGWLLGAEEGEV